MLIATACGMVDVVLIMGGRTTWNLGNAVLALIVNITVDLLLIPHLGILGAGIGWSAAILVNNLVPLSQIALVLGLHPFSRASLTAILIAGACFGAVPGVVRLLAGTELVPLLTASVIGTLLFLGSLWWQREPLALDALATLRPGRRPGRRHAPRHAQKKGT
ncbi:MAG: polysaccharide biosynthesis C-terminal domain-containing protein, partial [Pseudonocardiaceae bacterium]